MVLTWKLGSCFFCPSFLCFMLYFLKLTLSIVRPYSMMTEKLINQRLFRSVTSPNRLCKTPSITCIVLLDHLSQIPFFS